MIFIKRSILFTVLIALSLLPLSSAKDCGHGAEIAWYDRVIYFIGGTSAGLLSFFLIIGFIIYPPLRRQPGDLIFVLSLSDFTISIFWIISAFRNTVDADSFYCQFSAILSSFAATITVTYYFSFCYYLISVLKNSLKHSHVPYRSLHIIPITLSSIFIIFMISKNQFGINNYGSCSVVSTGDLQPWNGAIVMLAYIILAIVTQKYIKRFTPDCDRINHVKKDFLVYYNGLLTVTSVMWTVILITTILDALQNQEVFDGCWVPEVIHPISTIAKISSPFILSIFRYRDRFVGKYMAQLFFCFNKKDRIMSLGVPLTEKEKNDSQNESGLAIEMSEYSRDRTSTDNMSFSSDAPRKATLMEESAGIAAIAKNLRFQIIYTILCGVVYTDKVVRKKNLPKIEVLPDEEAVVKDGKVVSVKRKQSDIFQNFENYELNNETVKKEVPEYFEKMQRQKYEVLKGSFTFYCENIFSELRAQDQVFLDVQESLDAAANEEKVKKAGEGRGGKSGEFFFFSFDNKLIIKTMTSDELRVILEILSRYHKHHIHDNPKSLLAKIYGIFTFQRDNDPDPVHLIMMRNVNGWPGNCVVRKYDLKGSTFARQVEKRKNASRDSLSPEETYKDIDFLNYDQSFFIKQELKSVILDVIHKDVQFLKGCGIIDYSLAVYMIDKSKASQRGNGLLRMPTNESLGGNRFESKKPKAEEFNELYSMQSQQESNIFYNMGIIDYLQLYTFQKRAERFFKRLRSCDSKLDTSSSDPETYADRFLRFAEKVFSDTTKTESIETA